MGQTMCIRVMLSLCAKTILYNVDSVNKCGYCNATMIEVLEYLKKKMTAFIKLLQELAWNIDPIRTAVCLYALLIYHEKTIL